MVRCSISGASVLRVFKKAYNYELFMLNSYIFSALQNSLYLVSLGISPFRYRFFQWLLISTLIFL